MSKELLWHGVLCQDLGNPSPPGSSSFLIQRGHHEIHWAMLVIDWVRNTYHCLQGCSKVAIDPIVICVHNEGSMHKLLQWSESCMSWEILQHKAKESSIAVILTKQWGRDSWVIMDEGYVVCGVWDGNHECLTYDCPSEFLRMTDSSCLLPWKV